MTRDFNDYLNGEKFTTKIWYERRDLSRSTEITTNRLPITSTRYMTQYNETNSASFHVYYYTLNALFSEQLIWIFTRFTATPGTDSSCRRPATIYRSKNTKIHRIQRYNLCFITLYGFYLLCPHIFQHGESVVNVILI